MLSLAFLIAALVLFIVAALSVPVGKINLTAAGLACWVASALLAHYAV
jgi:hypothetical protein